MFAFLSRLLIIGVLLSCLCTDCVVCKMCVEMDAITANLIYLRVQIKKPEPVIYRESAYRALRLCVLLTQRACAEGRITILINM